MRHQSKHSITRVVRSMSVRARVSAAVVAAFLAGGVAITATAASASTGPSANLAAQVSSNTAAIAGNTAAITGLQGVAKQTSAALVTSPETVSTGGSFYANAKPIGTLPLTAGTYLIVFNAKATPNTDTNGAQVFPQFFVYNQVKNSSFTGDLFNVGAGALEPYGTNHDSYYSGSDVVTVPAGGETLNFYAFGYDSDTGGGAYALDMANVSAVSLAG